MPEFCQYLNCHNLGSFSYGGYCNEDHQRRGPESKFLFRIVETHKDISTIGQARKHWFLESKTSEKRSEINVTTFSSHCEECKALLRGSNVYQAK